MKHKKYQTVQINALCKYFTIIDKKEGFIVLKHSQGHNIVKIKIPFVLDEDIAKLAGLMPDGSLIKDLRRIYFHQEKDLSKLYLFRDLLIRNFSQNNKVFVGKTKRGSRTYINSTTLARFFYHILKIPKSDEQMNVPARVFNSPNTAKYAYLNEAFAMGGTILKSLYEIRFITKDYKFAKSIKELLMGIGIRSYGHTKPYNTGFLFIEKKI